MDGPASPRKIRVLVVDDSAAVRRTLSDILNADPAIAVMATAADPFIAAERIRAEVPDVITLDIEMPRMDGLTFLRKMMAQRPIPVVVCSSLTQEGTETLVDAMEAGAVEVIAKPSVGTRQFLLESAVRVCDAVKAAAHAMPRDGLDDWLRALAHLTRPGGRVVVIHKAESLAELLAACRGRFGGLTVRPIQPRAETAAIRVIVSGIKGSRAPLQLSAPFVLHGEGHAFTPAADAVLRLGAALDGAPSP